MTAKVFKKIREEADSFDNLYKLVISNWNHFIANMLQGRKTARVFEILEQNGHTWYRHSVNTLMKDDYWIWDLIVSLIVKDDDKEFDAFAMFENTGIECLVSGYKHDQWRSERIIHFKLKLNRADWPALAAARDAEQVARILAKDNPDMMEANPETL
jgi:hypothetical protein